jgi:hypothetical protein
VQGRQLEADLHGAERPEWGRRLPPATGLDLGQPRLVVAGAQQVADHLCKIKKIYCVFIDFFCNNYFFFVKKFLFINLCKNNFALNSLKSFFLLFWNFYYILFLNIFNYNY